MEALNRIKIETEKLLQLRLEQAGGNEDDIDVYFATCLDKALPEVFKILDQNDLLSNITAVSFLQAYIDRLLQQKPLTPLHSIEQDIEEWFDPMNPTAGPKHLDQYSPKSIEEGEITFHNIRDSAVIYDPGKKRYIDLDQITVFKEISSGVRFTTSSFINEKVREHYASLIRLNGYDKFVNTIEIKNWPYMPPSDSPLVSISWEDEAIRDAMEWSIEGDTNTAAVNLGSYREVYGDLIYFEKYDRVLFCLVFLTQGAYHTIPYLIPYTYDGIDMHEGLKNMAKHNTAWMRRVLASNDKLYQIIPQEELNCVEREDAKTEGYGFICSMPDNGAEHLRISQAITWDSKYYEESQYQCYTQYDYHDVKSLPLLDIIHKTEEILERHYQGCKQREAEIAAHRMYGCSPIGPRDVTDNGINEVKEAK